MSSSMSNEKSISKTESLDVETGALHVETIDNLLNESRQMWLLGAGISREAGIPLMYPLTNRVQALLTDSHQTDYKQILSDLTPNSHVEHVLSHLGDLIAIANRTREQKFQIGKSDRNVSELGLLHDAIKAAIRETVQWGFLEKKDLEPEVGDSSNPIVRISDHQQFISAIFSKRRAGFDRRPSVPFFILNYDTLIEDALALNKITYSDGFSGGAMAFWNPDEASHCFDQPFKGPFNAKVYKLHGSVDWFVSNEDVVVRRKEITTYSTESGDKLLIYPQATKYLLSQRDPFAKMFSAFRNGLHEVENTVLCICGYSFGDDHVNEEIERAMRQRNNSLTIIAFLSQSKSGQLPLTIQSWLSEKNSSWNNRIWVAGKFDIFHKSLTPVYTTSKEMKWWSFSGLTDFLKFGPVNLES